MARYHYNPSTGEPGYCRAKPGNCPFTAQGSVHFASKEEARRGYEEFEENGFQSLTAQLMVTRARVQREIIRIFTDPELQGSDDEETGLNGLVSERNAIEHTLRRSSDVLLHEPRQLRSDPQRAVYEEIGSDRGSTILGISNLQEGLLRAAPKTADSMVALSEQWLSTLSPAEARAVLDYSGSPESANGKGELLSSAVLKAPPIEATRVYSGLGVHVTKDVLRQYESGSIELGYPISTSLNPAQVNGFMGKFEGMVQQKAVALEIETTVGASMAAASHSPHEFEVMLPAGSYEVLSVREHVKFLWSEDGSGREAELLIKVRRLEE